MQYSVSDAARIVSRDKATLHRMVKNGRLSAVRDEVSGALRIDAAELQRVFALPSNSRDATQDATREVADATTRDAVRDGREALIQARLADKDALIAAYQAANEDLRRRLDRADDERARLLAQLGEQAAQIRLLTDQRTAPPALARRLWWRWGRRS